MKQKTKNTHTQTEKTDRNNKHPSDTQQHILQQSLKFSFGPARRATKHLTHINSGHFSRAPQETNPTTTKSTQKRHCKLQQLQSNRSK